MTSDQIAAAFGWLEKFQSIVAALLVALPIIYSAWRSIKDRAVTLEKEYEAKREEGLAALVPWVVRKGHEAFAAYKTFRGKSHPEKKEYIRDLVVAAHRRQNGEASITPEELERVVALAESYWKENKTGLQAEMSDRLAAALPDAPGEPLTISAPLTAVPGGGAEGKA